MKNNIGRKLTSLTLMTIMFAGGMTVAAPMSIGAFADQSTTVGQVSISSASIQGAQILEIVIDDPGISALDSVIGLPTLTYNGGATKNLTPAQAVDGKWYSYIVDDFYSTTADALADQGLNFGDDCGSTFALGSGVTLGDGTDGTWMLNGWSCADPDGPNDASIDAALNAQSDGQYEVLNDAPSLNRNSSANGGGQIQAQQNTTADTTVRATNGGATGAWPFVEQVTMASDNTVCYAGTCVPFTHGNLNGDISLSVEPDTYANGADVNIVLADNGLNIDPTTADKWQFNLIGGAATLKRTWSNQTTLTSSDIAGQLATIQFGEASTLTATGDIHATAATAALPFCVIATVEETGDNTGVFSTPDANGASDCDTHASATNHKSATLSYGGSSATIHIAYNGGSISMDAGDAWMPAEAATVTIVDADANRISGYDEALALNVLNAATTTPYIKTGSPVYLGSTSDGSVAVDFGCQETDHATVTEAASAQSDIGIYEMTVATACTGITSIAEFQVTHDALLSQLTNLTGNVVLNYDVSSMYDELNASSMTIEFGARFGLGSDFASRDTSTGTSSNGGTYFNSTDLSTGLNAGAGILSLKGECCDGASHYGANSSIGTAVGLAENIDMQFIFATPSSTTTMAAGVYPFAVDFFNFNSTDDVANAIYRLEAEESGTDGTFTGTVAYATMVHEGNSTNATSVIVPNGTDISLLLSSDKTAGSAPRILYGDTDENASIDQIGAQLDANTHTGTVAFDSASYGTESIAHVTLTDPDLNQDSGVRESYSQESTVTHDSTSGDTFSLSYNDVILPHTNFKLVETGADTGVFVGQFLTGATQIGEDLKFTYYDRKDAGGTSIDTYTSAEIATTSGSIAFDRAVYPVPFFNGWVTAGSGATLDNVFGASPAPTAGETHGNVTVYFQVTDPDETGETFTTSAYRVYIKLNGDVIAGAGGSAANTDTGDVGPMTEIERGSSIYEASFSLDQTETSFEDGNVLSTDPTSATHCDEGCAAFNVTSGMVLQAAYQDAADGGGGATTFYDSATVDLRTGSLSTDKEVYVIGSDIIVTITDPDLNLDGDSSESYSTQLVEWDSSASSSRLLSNSEFAANPSLFRETGSNTGVFQTVFTFPATVDTTAVEQGEAVTLTYLDQGLSGKDEVHDDSNDIEAVIYASNFGAIVELDKAIYDWTDRVLITVTAPDHNKDSEKEESIGTGTSLPVKVSTRQETFPSTGGYQLNETGEDTGVFTGEYVLKGFADGNIYTSSTVPAATGGENGNTDGVINTAGQTDGITVSYEYTDGSVSLASALIAWNIGEISFGDSSVSPGGSTTLTLVDGDLDLDPDVINTKAANVFSDSDSGGIQITLHETGEATGVFETTVFFTADDKSTGSLLRVSEGDTVTAEYTDQTLPEPYEQADTLTLAATATVGTVYPPLERAPASNARVVDAFGSQVSEVSADQQVQIAADVSNGTGKDQSFAYLVQVQDANGVTVSLAWITGSLTSGQSMSPALSWTPSASGSYTATVFVWQSVDNPTALSPTVSVNIDVV